jgi:hypothetical protein
VFQSEVAGHFLTSEFKDRINLKYQSLFLDNYIPKILKEKYMRISKNFQKIEKHVLYQNNFMSRFIELPDKNRICLNEELYEVSETMFCPQLFGFDHMSLPSILAKALKVLKNPK